MSIDCVIYFNQFSGVVPAETPKLPSQQKTDSSSQSSISSASHLTTAGILPPMHELGFMFAPASFSPSTPSPTQTSKNSSSPWPTIEERMSQGKKTASKTLEKISLSKAIEVLASLDLSRTKIIQSIFDDADESNNTYHRAGDISISPAQTQNSKAFADEILDRIAISDIVGQLNAEQLKHLESAIKLASDRIA